MEEIKPDGDGKIHLKLDRDDSALVVRTDGTIELVSSEMADNQDGYVGDIEDLNKTFSLVLALAASLEDKDLYDRIFHNLNKVLMNQWDSLDDEKKDDISKIRKEREEKRTDDEKEEKDKRVDDFKDRMNRHRQDYYADQQRRMMEDLYNEKEFLKRNEAEFAKPKRKIKKKKASLAYLKNIAWNPNDKSLTAHFKEFRADAPPPDEEE
ncbi:MAG: hypothetical protein QGH83_09605 [Candidatus Pacebacteria bacterium]|nr:hypothetical protein [Candidatus Paceibacterota bacterium]